MRPAGMLLEAQICPESFLMVWKPQRSQSLSAKNSSPRSPLPNHWTVLSPQPVLQYCQYQVAAHSCFIFIFWFLLSLNISLFLSAAIHIRASSHGFFLLGSASLASPCPGHRWHSRCWFPALALQNLLLHNLFLIPSSRQAGLLHLCSATHLHLTRNLFLFLVQFMWTASITLSQWSERTQGREVSNWSAAWIRNTQASFPLYYI